MHHADTLRQPSEFPGGEIPLRLPEHRTHIAVRGFRPPPE